MPVRIGSKLSCLIADFEFKYGIENLWLITIASTFIYGKYAPYGFVRCKVQFVCAFEWLLVQ